MNFYDPYHIASEEESDDDSDDDNRFDDCFEDLEDDDIGSDDTDDFYHVNDQNNNDGRTSTIPRSFVVTPPPFAEHRQQHTADDEVDETDDSTYYSIPISTTSSFSRQNNHRCRRTRPSTASSTTNNNVHAATSSASTIAVGIRVKVTKGKYQGQVGTILRLCPKLIHVQLENENRDAPRLKPDRLAIISGSYEQPSPSSSHHHHPMSEPAKTAPTSSAVDDDGEMDDSTFYSIPISTTSSSFSRESSNHFRSRPPPPTASSTYSNFCPGTSSASTIAVGIRVKVTKGKYQGQVGIVIRLCPKLVQVRLENDNHDAPRLQPDRLVIIPGGNQQPSPSSSSCHDPLTEPATASSYSEPPTFCDPHGFFNLYEDVAQFVTTTTRLSSQKHRTLAFRMFGFRLRHFTIPIHAAAVTSLQSTFPKEYMDSEGRHYSLLLTKLTKNLSKYGSFSQSQIQGYAVLSSPGLSLKRELECLAGFGRLSMEKVMARLSLLVTPAAVGIKNKNCTPFLLWDDSAEGVLSVDDLEDEQAGDDDDWNGGGCGFVPYSFMQRFLGNGIDAKRTFAIQVRIVCPKLGIYKGMLVVKNDISRIQLPSSMKKVGPSELHHANDQNKVYFLIKGIFPSKNNLHIAKRLHNQVPPQSFQPPKLSQMACAVFLARGVPREIIHQYVQKSRGKRGKHLQHAFLVGLRDPTNSIPEGHIFVTGSASTEVDDNTESKIGNKVLITRFPCTEALDARVLPVIKKRPPQMSVPDWNSLRELAFGGIVFGNSAKGNLPLPTMIANGDLDGDLYLVCWSKDMVDALSIDHFVQSSQMHVDEETLRTWNSSWFEDAQDKMRDVQYLMSTQKLISHLYRLWCGKMEKDPNSPDAKELGRAFKVSIDVAKHGVKVPLPMYLWELVKPEFHPFLINCTPE
jgi:ribosomal protein L24